MVNHKSRCLRLTIPYQIVGLAALWMASVGLMLAATLTGIEAQRGWAILIAGAAAAWTAIFGVGLIADRAVRVLSDHLLEQIDERRERWVADAGDCVIRRIELRELEEQVAQLQPSQR